MFGGRRHSGSRDMMIFVCHVTLQGHVIKAFCEFWLGVFQDMSPAKQDWRYNGFSLSRDLARSRDKRVMGLYG